MAVVEGDGESVVLVDPDASTADVVAAMDEVIGEWATDAWLHVGNCSGLRSVS